MKLGSPEEQQYEVVGFEFHPSDALFLIFREVYRSSFDHRHPISKAAFLNLEFQYLILLHQQPLLCTNMYMRQNQNQKIKIKKTVIPTLPLSKQCTSNHHQTPLSHYQRPSS